MSVPLAQADCNEVASSGDGATCGEVLAGYESADYCHVDVGAPSDGGVTGSCASLAACCANLTGSPEQECEGVVATGSPSACGQALETYRASDTCQGSKDASLDSATHSGDANDVDIGEDAGNPSSCGPGESTCTAYAQHLCGCTPGYCDSGDNFDSVCGGCIVFEEGDAAWQGLVECIATSSCADIAKCKSPP